MSAENWFRRASGLLVPSLRFANSLNRWGVCSVPCCETTGGQPCAACDANGPDYIELTLAGITNGTCADCAAGWNGTHLIEGIFEETACTWNKRFVLPCTEGGLTCDITFGFGWGINTLFSVLQAGVGAFGSSASYVCNDPDETDCMNWTDLVMTKDAEYPGLYQYCNDWPETYLVSAA